MADFQIFLSGDSAVTLQFGTAIDETISARIHGALVALEQAKLPGITELVQTYCTLMVHYDPIILGYDELCEQLKRILADTGNAAGSGVRKVIEIPVCYGGMYGPDMAGVCSHAGMTEAELIARHSAPDYQIYMLGFLPGFAYLGGMDDALETPRLSNPRTRIEPGSVGIAGKQTGIYPLASPGGWQLIGRTPVKPYDPTREEPILYRAGEYLHFVPITREEYMRIERLAAAGDYQCVTREVRV